MKTLNIPYPHLARSANVHEVEGGNQKKKKNQSLNVAERADRQAVWHVTRPFLMINANSNDSGPVSCVCVCVRVYACTYMCVFVCTRARFR